MKAKKPAPAGSTVTPAIIMGGLAIFNGGMESLLYDLQHGTPSEQARAEDALRKVGAYGLTPVLQALSSSKDVAFSVRLIALVVAEGAVGANALAPYVTSLMAPDRDPQIREAVLRAIVHLGAERSAREQAARANKAAARRDEQAATAGSAKKEAWLPNEQRRPE